MKSDDLLTRIAAVVLLVGYASLIILLAAIA